MSKSEEVYLHYPSLTNGAYDNTLFLKLNVSGEKTQRQKFTVNMTMLAAL